MIIVPPYLPKIQASDKVVFLAGPIRGAAQWHEDASRLFQNYLHCSKVHVASPARLRNIDKQLLNAPVMESSRVMQYDWETFWLNRAAKCGIIMFWLAREETRYLERTYSQTTRFELAEWKERAMNGKASIILGIEPGWTGETYIRHRLSHDLPDLTIHDTLESTVAATIKSIVSPKD